MSLAALSGFAQGFAGTRQAVQARKDRQALTAALDRFSGGLGAIPAAAGTTGAPMPAAGGAPVSMGAYNGAIGDRPKFAFEYFVKAGLPRHVAAGLVGNLMQDAGAEIDPGAVGDNGNAFGSVQWNGPRMRSYFEYADGRGRDRLDFENQLDYLRHEGRTTEKSAWAKIMAANTAEEAATIASDAFWRPGVPHKERRASYANAIYRRYGADGIPVAMGIGPS